MPILDKLKELIFLFSSLIDRLLILIEKLADWLVGVIILLLNIILDFAIESARWILNYL